MSKTKMVAPDKVYVEIEDGKAVLVNEDPEEAENARSNDNSLAEYKLVGFVKIEYQTVVTPVKS